MALGPTPAFFQQLVGATGSGSEAVIPIHKVTLSGGGRFFALPVRVGSKELLAGIDTVSPGLRVLAPALGPGDFQSSNQPGRMEFKSGTILNGIRATADVGFDSVHGPVTIEFVQKVTCAPRVQGFPT